jgi:hypothetical protein
MSLLMIYPELKTHILMLLLLSDKTLLVPAHNHIPPTSASFYEDACCALRTFFRVTRNSVPVDLNDTTFLPTPSKESHLQRLPETLVTPPPAY